ncbi:MAG: hypothetical protein JRI57_10355 [Deltaproteobacteria bacterium]|nr:hypothetical protein [Deltaproteobacteria bacterium]MBW1952280.1 hypothetical protein [Deltaproteobacteria bacterium]MBW2133987.1 hypothetical protein [Deltaproteobacteria bacterium]
MATNGLAARPQGEESLAAPSSGQVMVTTLISAISPGTELLVYRFSVMNLLRRTGKRSAWNNRLDRVLYRLAFK